MSNSAILERRIMFIGTWLGTALLCFAPFIIDTDIGKILAMSGLACLNLQAVDKKCYNLLIINTIAITGYAYALYI